MRDGLPHLLWPADDQRVLLLGHYDTVWPEGTVRDWPFALTDGIATGPGVCDMKAGIVQMVTALSLLPDTSRVGVLLTCDEESGSPTSRPLIEQQARRSRAVLVGEPSTETGAVKVARKGGSMYEITIRGRAAHAGVEPHRGVNAAVELAHQVLAVRAFAAEGTSVTPTVLSAGSISNQVPESATFCVDVRAWTREELDRVDRLIHAMTPRLTDAALVVGGGINRYPLQEAVATPLLEIARRAGRELGLPPLEAAHAAGASDANFTGSLGVATLDGLGGVGGGVARPHRVGGRHPDARPRRPARRDGRRRAHAAAPGPRRRGPGRPRAPLTRVAAPQGAGIPSIMVRRDGAPPGPRAAAHPPAVHVRGRRRSEREDDRPMTLTTRQPTPPPRFGVEEEFLAIRR